MVVDFDSREQWDFSDMLVDEVVRVTGDKERRQKAQKYVHTYACKTNKQFKTRTVENVLFVKRVS